MLKINYHSIFQVYNLKYAANYSETVVGCIFNIMYIRNKIIHINHNTLQYFIKQL